MSRSVRRIRVSLSLVGLAGACVLGGVRTARAQDLQVSANVSPRVVRIGQLATYTGRVVLPNGDVGRIRFSPPDSSTALTWGPLRANRRQTSGSAVDTIVVQAELQAFRIGMLSIPGLVFVDPAGPSGVTRRLPVVGLSVVPVIPAGDSTADLHPVRGPLKAPWWEVVPWGWVIGLALAAGAIAWLMMRLRRKPVYVSRPAVRVDPADTALARLRDLRQRRLPEAGEFGLHAFELTSILRRYLESTTTRLRPGFTTSELSGQLKDETLPAEDALLLVSLMRVWDRVKFARLAYTPEEARKSEQAVELFVRRRGPTPNQEAA